MRSRLLFQRAVELLLVALMAAAVVPPARGQTVISGIYSGTQITGDVSILTSTNATFTQGAAFSGTNATFGDNAFLYWNQNGSLAGKTFTVGTNSGIVVGLNNTLTLDSATSMGGGVWLYSDNAGASITNQAIIHHTTGTGYIYAPTFSNQGSIAAGANTNLYVGYTAGYSITNASGGTITADGTNANISLIGIANQGTITAQNGGALYFRGNNTTANLGAVTIGTGGGHAYLVGTFDNNATALAGPTGGSYELYGGTINGGFVTPGALTFTSSGGTLQNVSYQGDLTLGASTTVTFGGSTNFTGANANLGTNASVAWNENGTLTGKTITLGTNAGFIVGAGNSLTLDNATALTGGVYLYSDNAGASITNQGGIHHTTGTGYIYAETFTNQGSIVGGAGTNLFVGYTTGYSITNASGGTITADGANAGIYLYGINNQGTLTAQNGGLLYFRGNNTTASLGNVAIGTGGGHAYLNGTLDNTAATLNAPTGGSYELYGGTIKSGTIAPGALTFTSSGGTLNGVSYSGDLSLPSYSSVTFTNGTAFTGSNANLGTGASITWNQSGRLSGANLTMGTGSAVIVGSGNALTLDTNTTAGGDVTVYSDYAGASLTNNGVVNHTTGVGYLYAATFTNQGTVNVGANSSLYVGYTAGYSITNASSGTITADGTYASAYLRGIANQGSLTARNGGLLYFQGNNTTADLGSVTIGTGGGHAYLNGTLDNTTATLTAPTGGSFELFGGTINNGTIAAGALTFTTSGGTLSNVSYSGDLSLPTSTYVYLANGTAFTGANLALANGAGVYWNQSGTLSGKTLSFGNGAYLSPWTGNSLTLAATTTATGDVSIDSSGAGASITNQGTINHTAGTGYLYAPTFTNQGSITAGPNSSLWFGYNSTYTTTNASGGTVTADGANASIYSWGVINQGTLKAQNGGVLYIGGNYATSNLGNIAIGAGGGHAYLTNTLDNTSATLTAPTGGTFELYGGTINNGAIAAGALTFTGSNGTLSNVSYTGDLTLPTSSAVTFTNGTSFTGTNASLGSGAGLYWNQTGTLAGKNLTMAPASYVYLGPGTALTLDGATTVSGTVEIYAGYTGTSITNQGTITHNSGTGYLYAPTLTNQGTVTAGAGSNLYYGYNAGETTTNASTGTLTADGASTNLWLHGLLNQGTVKAQNGGAVYFWGNNVTSDLGSVTIGAGGGHAYLYNTLDNTGATLNTPAGGTFELYAGTINNGAIAPGALSFTSANGTLSNVSYGGDLVLPASSYLTLTNGSTVTGTNLGLGSYAGLYWSQSGTVAGKALSFGTGAFIDLGANNAALTLDSATTATGDIEIYSGNAGASVTNQGTLNHTTGTGYLYAQTFTNQGTVNIGASSYLYLGTNSAGYTFANPAGGAINVTGGTANLQSALTNAGIINVQSGTFYAITGALTNGSTGTIMGSGTVYGNLTLAGGTLSPGNSIGTLTVASGNLIVSNPALLNMELGGATGDQILIQNPPGAIDIGSGLLTLNLSLLGAPTASVYNLINITGGSGFTGYLAGFPISGDTITATYLGTPYTFSVQYLPTGVALNFAAIPEPSVVALMAAGLLAVAGTGWRRTRRRQER